MQDTIKLTLPKIGCQGCMKKVTTALHTIPGVQIAATDVATKSVVLAYDTDQTNMEQIESTLSQVGHVIGNVETTPYV